MFLLSFPRGSHIQRLQSSLVHQRFCCGQAVSCYVCDVWGQSPFEVLWRFLAKGEGEGSLCAYRGVRWVWIAFCGHFKWYRFVHCVDTTDQIPSFLLLDGAISSRHLTHSSQGVLSDAGQIETHWAASLCACTCGSVQLRSAWVRASVCVRVCKRWIRRHLQSYSIWCLCLHENTCLQWDSLSCCWACNMHHRPRLIRFFFRFDVALKMIFIYFLPSFLLTVWYGLPMTHDLWQDYCTNKQQAAQCSPCKMTSVSLSSIASITAQSRL